MNIQILGGHGGVEPDYNTTNFLIEGKFLIDCGSVCSVLTPCQQMAVSDIFITHPHLDHIKDICFLLENTFQKNRNPIFLRSTKEILDDIRSHLLNDVIWPDFSKIYLDDEATKPFVQYRPMKTAVSVEGIEVSYFKVNHIGNAIGFILDDGNSQVVISGDTGPCPLLWKKADECPNLKAVFTEVSFPSRMDSLAKAAGHFTLTQLLEDMMNFENREAPVYISHFKPMFFKELLEEFHIKAPRRLQLVHDQDEFKFQ